MTRRADEVSLTAQRWTAANDFSKKFEFLTGSSAQSKLAILLTLLQSPQVLVSWRLRRINQQVQAFIPCGVKKLLLRFRTPLLLCAAVAFWRTWSRIFRLLHESKAAKKTRLKSEELKLAMKVATTYKKWGTAARGLDILEERKNTRENAQVDLCDDVSAADMEDLPFEDDTERIYGHKLLEDLHHRANLGCQQGVEDMISALRAGLLHSLQGLKSTQMPKNTRRTTYPPGVKQYIQEVRRVLKYLTDHEYPGFSSQRKLVLLRETQLIMGRSALVLSGGAALGCFHIGVAKALLECRLLPQVIVGSSAGAIVGGIIATRTSEEMTDLLNEYVEFAKQLTFFSNAGASGRLWNWMRTGALMMGMELETSLRKLYGDVTFAEAFERTGRIFCVSICPTRANEQPRLLCHLTAPHVVVWSAVFASSAFPGLFPSQDLLTRTADGSFEIYHAMSGPAKECGPMGSEPCRSDRRWRDGSLESDLPLQAVCELFNVQFFIVSQANPHIIPLLHVRQLIQYLPMSNLFRWIGRHIEDEFKMRCAQVKRIMGSGLLFWGAALFSQEWTGREEDVTVVCPMSIRDIANCIGNPTEKDFLDFLLAGERAIWPAMATLKCHLKVELQLAECAAQLQQVSRERRGAKATGLDDLAQRGSLDNSSVNRCPSWNTLMEIARGDSFSEE